jgi:hypothetical protein
MTAKGRRTILGFGALAAVLYALWRLIEARRRESGISWEPQPFPSPPRPRPESAPVPASGEPVRPAAPTGEVAAGAATAGWIEPVDGACPATHPVKAKLSSGIYHVPGAQMYERTRPDRCYTDPEAAEADGLRASKR